MPIIRVVKMVVYDDKTITVTNHSFVFEAAFPDDADEHLTQKLERVD